MRANFEDSPVHGEYALEADASVTKEVLGTNNSYASREARNFQVREKMAAELIQQGLSEQAAARLLHLPFLP